MRLDGLSRVYKPVNRLEASAARVEDSGTSVGHLITEICIIFGPRTSGQWERS